MRKVNWIALAQIITALLIVNYHTNTLAIPVLNKIAKFGFIFNTIFVFLSGYLLSQSLSATANPTFREFLNKRITRIFPSLHMALIVIALLYLVIGQNFTINGLLLAATGFAYFFGDNTFGPHLWFVSVILVCYLLCIPTYYALKRRPMVILAALISLFLLVLFIREGTFYGIYEKVSTDIGYRFLYHYIVFSLAIYLGFDENNFSNRNWIWLGLVGVGFLLYLFLQPNPYFDVLILGISVFLAVGIIKSIILISPWVEKYFSVIFLLSSFTYELYLVHFPIIAAINGWYHGQWFAYPLVFLTSILLALVILALSTLYERLLRRGAEGLFHRAPLMTEEIGGRAIPQMEENGKKKTGLP